MPRRKNIQKQWRTYSGHQRRGHGTGHDSASVYHLWPPDFDLAFLNKPSFVKTRCDENEMTGVWNRFDLIPGNCEGSQPLWLSLLSAWNSQSSCPPSQTPIYARNTPRDTQKSAGLMLTHEWTVRAGPYSGPSGRWAGPLWEAEVNGLFLSLSSILACCSEIHRERMNSSHFQSSQRLPEEWPADQQETMTTVQGNGSAMNCPLMLGQAGCSGPWTYLYLISPQPWGVGNPVFILRIRKWCQARRRGDEDPKSILPDVKASF